MQQAIRNGIARVSQTGRHVEWFEAAEIRGHVADGEVDHFPTTMKVGFRLDEWRPAGVVSVDVDSGPSHRDRRPGSSPPSRSALRAGRRTTRSPAWSASTRSTPDDPDLDSTATAILQGAREFEGRDLDV